MLANLIHGGGRYGSLNYYAGVPAEILQEGGIRYSKDYKVAYMPVVSVVAGTDGEELSEVNFNQQVIIRSWATEVRDSHMIVVPHPELRKYFKEIEASPLLDNGEAIQVYAKAKRKLSVAELQEELSYAFRISILL